MAERIVYILGAGFSAPLGLPVMANFLEKARDLSESLPAKGRQLGDVLAEIETLHKSASFFRGDLLDVEEVLSLLHTRGVLAGEITKGRFAQFVSTVIDKWTPAFPGFEGQHPASNWEVQIFGDNKRRAAYTCFAASLVYARIIERSLAHDVKPSDYFTFEPRDSKCTQYTVVSLNYDDVLERALSALTQYTGPFLGFGDPFELAEAGPGAERLLLKPHGGVDDANLLPPTWNKELAPYHIATWNAVIQSLARATHIRIMGYSLPESDTYIKYFLKVAMLSSTSLKRIDVISRDNKGDVQKRYDSFIAFRNYRFRRGDIAEYLAGILQRTTRGMGEPLELDQIEAAHEAFFR